MPRTKAERWDWAVATAAEPGPDDAAEAQDGMVPLDEDDLASLEVAHITDAVAFVRAAGHHRGVTFSYRWDNLVTLCGACHRASHAHRFHEEILARRAKVGRLMEDLRRLRGWSSPFAALPPELVPTALRPLRSFHDVMRISPLVPFATYGKYAADGGLVFGESESRSVQARLDPAMDEAAAK